VRHFSNKKKTTMAEQREVYYVLLDASGEPFNGKCMDKVRMPSDGDFIDFRRKVKEACDEEGEDLKGIGATKLRVYVSETDREAGNAVEGAKIDNHGKEHTKPLMVVVPAVAGAISQQHLITSYDLLQLVLPNVLTNAPTSLSGRNQDFKHNLCQFYGCYRRKQRWIQCMVLDIPFPKAVVTAAHLFRRSNEYLAFPLMQIQDIDDPKNGMLMFKPLEYAFDHFQISFIAEGDRTSFKLKLFDQSIQNTLLIDFIRDPNQRQVVMDAISIANPKKRCKFDLQTTFGHIDGKRVAFPSPSRPFNRCLNLQARLAYMIALKKGSFDASYQFDDFWSEGMSLEDKMEIFQQSISANY
jgi:hypothetical protein